jgi:hypothetical protein
MNRTWRSASLCAAFLFVVAVPLHAGQVRFLSPSAGDRISPGSVVEVAWRGAEHFGASAPSFDEIELLLFIDDGRVAPIRISLRMAAGTDRFSWRVPAFRARHAHLAIRAGWDGDLGGEQIAGVSGDFSVAPSESASIEALFRVEGEWRTAQALSGSERPLLPAATVGSMPQIRSLRPLVFALGSHERGLSGPERISDPADEGAEQTPRPRSPDSPPRLPAPIPLRS